MTEARTKHDVLAAPLAAASKAMATLRELLPPHSTHQFLGAFQNEIDAAGPEVISTEPTDDKTAARAEALKTYTEEAQGYIDQLPGLAGRIKKRTEEVNATEQLIHDLQRSGWEFSHEMLTDLSAQRRGITAAAHVLGESGGLGDIKTVKAYQEIRYIDTTPIRNASAQWLAVIKHVEGHPLGALSYTQIHQNLTEGIRHLRKQFGMVEEVLELDSCLNALPGPEYFGKVVSNLDDLVSSHRDKRSIATAEKATQLMEDTTGFFERLYYLHDRFIDYQSTLQRNIEELRESINALLQRIVKNYNQPDFLAGSAEGLREELADIQSEALTLNQAADFLAATGAQKQVEALAARLENVEFQARQNDMRNHHFLNRNLHWAALVLFIICLVIVVSMGQ